MAELAQPLVSVVMPAYAASDHISSTIRSVIAQTMDRWELIVVDDGSPDDLAAAIRPFREDPRIRFVRHPENRGVSAARNTGIAHAQARFVAFLDSDDTWLPQKLERQLAAVLDAPNPDDVFCVTQTVVILPGNREIVRPTRAKHADERLDEFIFVAGNFCQTSSFLVSREVAASVGFREIPIGEDHLFAIEVVQQGSRYLLVEDPLTVYVNDERPGRLSRRDSLAKGEAFMRAARGVLSPKALAAYEIRYLGAHIIRRSRREFARKFVRAVAMRALPARFAVTLLTRIAVPSWLYGPMRARVLGRRGNG